MQVHASRDIPWAIIVDDDSIKRIWSHVHSYTNTAKAEVRCFDEITRTFETLEGLLSYENNPRAFIKQIEISGRSHEQERSITITLGRSYSPPTSLSIRGEEIDASIAQDKIRDTIHGMKAWYSRVATLDMYIFWFIVMMLCMLTLQLMVPSNTTPSPGRSFKEALLALPYVLLVLGGVAATVWLTVFIRRRFFPMVSFAMGQGAKRYQFDEQIRWTVIVGFLVGIAGSIAFASLGG
jgi:hypothetical protein